MKLAVLYSGGKDSTLALMKVGEKHEIACLVSVISENKHSFMFHTPNIDITLLQARALGLPLIQVKTKGEKEDELADLKRAIAEAKQRYKIEGVVTGAVKSKYQAKRIQKICDELGLECINPLWQMDEKQLLQEIIDSKMEVIISGVFAEPLDETYLGQVIDGKMAKRLAGIADTHKISPVGEGGEIETTVLDCPAFRKKIRVTGSRKEHENYSGFFIIDDAELVEKH